MPMNFPSRARDTHSAFSLTVGDSRMKRRAIGLTAALGVLLHAGIARADDGPEKKPDAPPAQTSTPPAATTDPAPTTPPDARTPKQQLERPPFEPVPVPNPSPVVVGGTPTAPGHAVQPLVWNRARFSTADFVVMAAGGALTLTGAIIKPFNKHNLVGPILFDKGIESTLKAPTTQTQYVYRDASDVGLSLEATWPFFVDALITAWWYRGSRDVAEQMSLLGLETLAVSGAVQGITNTLVSRPRPYSDQCGKTVRPDSIDCDGNTHYRSFFSGHSAFSFTAASLICFEHLNLNLLGGPWDAISCAGGYVVAAATATFRVAGAEHYPSDVLTGALVGSLVGWGVPLLHFKHPNAGTIKTSGGLTMKVVPSGAGAGLVGMF